MKFLLSIVVINILTVSTYGLNETYCKSLGAEVDSLLKDIIHMKPDPLFPNSTINRDAFCGPSSAVIKKANLYVKCLPAFQAQVISILSKSTRKPLKMICKGNEKKIIATYSCMDTEFKRVLHQQQASFLHSLVVIKEKVSQEKLHSSFCCTARNVSESLLVNLPERKCKGYPDISLPRYFYNVIEASLDDTLDLVCGSFPTFKVCQEKAKDAVTFLQDHFSANVDTSEIPLVQTVLQIISKLAS